MPAGHWQIGLAYRRLYASEWYVGTRVSEADAPFGKPLYLNINSIDLSVLFGVTPQLSLALTLPFSYGTHSRFYADLRRHQVSALGLGDINLIGTYWVRDPAHAAGGNMAFGLGLKSATGPNEVQDDFFQADSTVVLRPVDTSIQLGDGGWGVIVQAQVFRRLFTRTHGYFFGSYLLSPKGETGVPSPVPGFNLSVPDVYSARLGLAYGVAPSAGLSASLGGRIDGIPFKDLVGGHQGFRRPGYSLYLDPGLSLTRGPLTFSTSVPIALHQNFKRSVAEIAAGKKGGGDLAEYLIFGGVTWRF